MRELVLGIFSFVGDYFVVEIFLKGVGIFLVVWDVEGGGEIWGAPK